MAVEGDVHGEVSEVSKVEIEEKCGLDLPTLLSSYEDLPKGGGGDCNGVLHAEREEDGIIRNGKDDADGSYVFVSGSDACADDPVDRDLNAKCVEELTVPESNVGAPNEEIEVRVGESKVENGENVQSRVEDNCIVEGAFIVPSNTDVTLEDSPCEPSGDEEGRSDAVEEQNGTVAAESEPQHVDSELKAEEQIMLESSSELEESHESQVMVSEEAVCELPQVDDGSVKDGEQNIVDSIAEVEESQESQITTTESVESELNNGEKEEVEGESKSDLAIDKKENQEPENMVCEDIQLELDQEKEAAELGNEITAEGPPGDHRMDMESDLEMATCPVTNIQLETEVANGSASDEKSNSLSTCHVEDGVPETTVINDLVDDSQNTPELDGSSENAESLPLPVNCVRSEIEVGNVPFESGESLPSGHGNDSVIEPDVGTGASLITENFPSSAVDNVRSATEFEEFDAKSGESVLSCPVDDTKSEIEVENGPVEGDGMSSCPADDARSEPEIGLNSINCEEKVSTLPCEDVQLELDQEKEAAELGNEITAEGPPGDHRMDMESDCPLTDIQLETEVANGSASDENSNSLPTCHVQDGVPETKVINDLVDDSQNTPELDGSSENVESLPLPVDCVRSEIEVGNVPFESGESLPSGHDNDSVIEKVPFESGESLPSGHDNDSVIEPDVGTGASLITENFPSSAVDDVRSATEFEEFDAKSGESVLSCPVDDTKSEIEVENGPVEGDGMSSCPANDVRSEPDISLNSINCEEKVSTLPCEDVNIEPNVSNGVIECACSQSIPVDDLDVESHVTDSVENESSLSNCPGADVKSESEVENASDLISGDIPSNDATVSEFEVLNGSVVNSGSALHCVPDVVDVEKEGDQSATGDSDDKQICQENEVIEETDRDETAASSPEGSSADALDGQNVGTEVGKRPFYCLIRIPRYDDENLRDQIKHALLQVDEKTQIRDAIRVEVQTKRGTCKKYGDNFEAAISEERTARDLLKSKRQEIDSVQSVINRVKNAISVEDIDGRIRNMEHMIQHETLPLKEEKQFIREIKQLKQLREQLSSSMGRQDEVQQAMDQRDQIEERFKSLKKEVDLLRGNVQKAEVVTKAAKKKYFEETGKLNEFQAKFKAADDIRQEAYTHLLNLRKQLSEKNKYFRMYKDDEKAVNDYALNGDREALQRLCDNQVETIMELWNKNDEFRKDYIRCNIRSTVRRLRTLDGRSLGPDEEPPVLPNFVNVRVHKSLNAPAEGNSVSLISTLEQEKLLVPVEAEKADDKSVAKVVEQKNQTIKTKKPTKPTPPTPLGNGSATVSGRDESEEAKEEEHKQTKEEEELVRKAEELRKEEAAAKLKEQRRLEEKAKAKEALERKKRSIDKAQARAELRAQKEAEQKEKEREKKARKKDRKKVAVADGTNGSNDGDSARSSETPTESMESEIREKPLAITKRPQKSAQFTKQNKAKAIPPPLRNKGKRRVQPWMWVLLATLLLVAIFLVGNSGFSFNLGLQRFGF